MDIPTIVNWASYGGIQNKKKRELQITFFLNSKNHKTHLYSATVLWNFFIYEKKLIKKFNENSV